MLFDAPVAMTTALRVLGEKALMPTNLSSLALRALDRDIRAKSLFSARTMYVDYLGEIKDQVGAMLAGETNLATGRIELQQKLRKLAYERREKAGAANIGEGPITDLSSDRRIDLVLNTNLRMAANQGEKLDGEGEDARWQFPARELVRFYDREVPRGYERRGGGLQAVPGDSWLDRWVRAGGRLVQGRMVALKDDAVWGRLGDSGLFEDGTDSEVPPYAFNSGYDWIEVGRAECVALGLITGDEQPKASSARLAGKLFEDGTNATLADLHAAREELLQAAAAWRTAA